MARSNPSINVLLAIAAVFGCGIVISRFMFVAVAIVINVAIPYAVPISPQAVDVAALQDAPISAINTNQVDLILSGVSPGLQLLLVTSALIPTIFLSLALGTLARVSLALRAARPFSRTITRSLLFGASAVLAAGIFGETIRAVTDRAVFSMTFAADSPLRPEGAAAVNGTLIFIGLGLLLAATTLAQAERMQRDTEGLV